jgi:D-alanine-D-alanine ligase
VFNIAEYVDERHKRGFIPGLLDGLGYPHLGSSAFAVRTALDKGRTKSLLVGRGIPTPRYFVAEPGDSRIAERAAGIGYPLLVKPLAEGGHAGIGEDSIVHDASALHAAVGRILLAYHQPSLVEEYIGGGEMREFSVGIVGNAIRTHLPLEIDWHSMDVQTRILSFEAARRGHERVTPVADRVTTEALNELADRTFDAVGAADYARVDIRGNRNGLFVLEINAMPGLGPRSFMSLAARDMLGFDHADLIGVITLQSIRRQGFPEAA